ncbi:cysteine-rich receptor-like protein kinase 44 [Rosa rugosa]|uniref:cysteine-rich receptor-like protein kinase 44 n=1 Tax=Rosa rugosa TaxID=74645 RepID=UPI002B41310F|nr:cysteine-rich receptor-like protein kinase 44 [Rosa rugosa]
MVFSSFGFGIFLSILLLVLVIIEAIDLHLVCSNNSGNYTTGSVYQKNLDYFLSSLVTNKSINGYGFYNSSFGQDDDVVDKVHAIGLCRPDLNASLGLNIFKDSAHNLTRACPNQKEAIIWNDYCMLRYSNRPFHFELSPSYNQSTTGSLSSSDVDFNSELEELIGVLKTQAAAGDLRKKFATETKRVTYSNNQSISGRVQCIPVLSEKECTDCLGEGLRQLQKCCNGMVSASFGNPSCNLRYEVFSSHDPAKYDEPRALSPHTPTSAKNSGGNKKSSTSAGTIIIIAMATVVSFLILIMSICTYLRVKYKRKRIEERAEEIKSAEALQFDFRSIRAATNNFSEANKLGRGGFGIVYRGILPDDKDIAVKRLSRDSAQGDLEFKTEVSLVARLQHRNLVRLLGFCLGKNEKILVYEFVPNGSLDQFIFGEVKRAHLDWDVRYKIIVGIARGLLYLHEDSRLKIIHRDLKASNILLDADMNPKVADFGMARLFDLDQSQGETRRVVGTYGYMAPEYVMRGQFSVKSDVFSFGVLVLEIVSGQKNSSFRNRGNVEDLLSYAWKNWRADTASNIIEPILSSGSRTEMMRCINIGLLCVQQNIADRPTMTSVILMLTGNSLSLPVPSQPAFFMGASDFSKVVELDQAQSSSSVQKSVNEASITELSPR